MLGFLKKLTMTPDEVTPADAEALRKEGLDDEMIGDAIHVCAGFNAIVRLADSFNFYVGEDEMFDAIAVTLMKRGYK